MTVPMQYARASAEFDAFLDELRQSLDHSTRHPTFQTLQSVLRIFRRRLTVPEAIAFADALPAVLRAMFVSDWDLTEPQRPFDEFATLNAEVKQFRVGHDLSPPDAIQQVATVLRRHIVDRLAFERALAALPPEAKAFWTAIEDAQS